jgi:DNA topoisomerase-1
LARSSRENRRERRSDGIDPARAAELANLEYVEDSVPGIRRIHRGRTFEYVDPRNRKVRDLSVLSRIRSLVIPPAWKGVWICTKPNGHLQATGRDARGRKQYRYHPRWRETRDEAKYQNVIDFATSLPRIRRRVRRDLHRRGLPREKVLAAIVRLLETTLIRVGNEEYARVNGSFGLTTMRDEHADVRGSKIRFEFRGKSGIEYEIDLKDPRLATVVQKCQDLPGQQLFQYVDGNGEVRDVGSDDVNEYLREISGREFTAKDFRTWAGTSLAARALREFEDFDSQAAAKRNITRAIERVAARLGNTKTVCRKCYVHPAVIEAYLDHSLVETLKAHTERELRDILPKLPAEEAAVLALLQQRIERERQSNHVKPKRTARRSPSKLRRLAEKNNRGRIKQSRLIPAGRS